MSATAQMKDRAKQLRTRFATAKDWLQVKSHLLGMEAKDASDQIDAYLGKVEAQIDTFVDKISEETGEARLQAQLALMEARERLFDARDELQHLVQDASNKAQDVRTKFDYARLQSHLAKMDAQERWDEKRKQWRDAFVSARDGGEEQTQQAVDSADEMIRTICKEMPR